jgi:hypothetical protein
VWFAALELFWAALVGTTQSTELLAEAWHTTTATLVWLTLH